MPTTTFMICPHTVICGEDSKHPINNIKELDQTNVSLSLLEATHYKYTEILLMR